LGSPREADKPKDEETMPQKSLVRELAEGLITAVLVAFLLKLFIIEAFRIPSGSMIPTLDVGDQILVYKLAYGVRSPFGDHYWVRFHDPSRGDVVVFRYPKDETKDFIKRVIGLPGDRIAVKNKIVYVNGKPLTEHYVQYLQPLDFGQGVRDNMPETLVPPNDFFVMGDNRDDSYDSRFWGFVDRRKILGRALIIYWSWNTVGKSIRFDRIGKLIH
jgi:signal peptidase I